MNTGNKAALLPTDERIPAIVERLRLGAPLLRESKALGFTHNGQLRAALRALLGEDGYAKLMEGRSGRSSLRRAAPSKETATQQASEIGSRSGSQKAKATDSRKATPPLSAAKPEASADVSAGPDTAGHLEAVGNAPASIAENS